MCVYVYISAKCARVGKKPVSIFMLTRSITLTNKCRSSSGRDIRVNVCMFVYKYVYVCLYKNKHLQQQQQQQACGKKQYFP